MWTDKYTLITLVSFLVAFIAISVKSEHKSRLFGTSEFKEGDRQVGTGGSDSKYKIKQARPIFKYGHRRTSAFFAKKQAFGNIEPRRKTSHSAVNSKTSKQSSVYVNILVKSGKITMKRSSFKEGTKMIMIEFDSLQEIDADGGVIDSPEHKLTTFANQTFQFSDLRNGFYQDTGIGCKIITFQSKLHNGATVKIHLYLFKESGTITNGKDTTIVKPGDLKFDVELSDWPFCTSASNCPNNVAGKYLDLVIVMGGSKKATQVHCKKTPTYNLGSGFVVLSKILVVDGITKEMVEGFPVLNKQRRKDKFMFRFPEFHYKILYDPFVTIPAVFETVTGTVVVQPEEIDF